MNAVVHVTFYFHHEDVKDVDVRIELYDHAEYILDIAVFAVSRIYLEEQKYLYFD
jgi:hypothetical protein